MENFKAAARSLLSTPGPSIVVIATLAIAIGANTAIFSVVEGVLLRPLGYGDEGRLVVLWATNEHDIFRLSPADYRDVRDGAEAFDGQVVLYRSIGSTLTGRERPVRVGSLSVTPGLFRVLETKPAAGRFFTDEDEKPGGEKKLVITHACWTRRFGSDPSITGSTIELDSQPYTVVGVTEPGFQFPPGNDEVEMYFPMTLSDSVLLDRTHRMFDAVARLADGVTVDAARAELALISDRLAREFAEANQGWGLTARSFSQLSEVDPGFRQEGVTSLAVQLPSSRYDRAEWGPFFERLVERIEGLPGVHAAGAVSDLPMSDVGLGFELEFTVLGLDALSPTARPNAELRLALPGYFDAMDIEIVRGRAFDRLDVTSNRTVAIVNETLVERYFRQGGQDVDPIGRSVSVAALGEIEIVGVVSDIRHGVCETKNQNGHEGHLD